MLTVQGIISRREQYKEKLRKEFMLEPITQVAIETPEESFLKDLRASLERHLSDEQFGVEALCVELQTSRTNLHRRLKSITGQSAGSVIREFRLEKARQLFENRAGNISQVAYDVGFSNPAYFSKCFREYHGVSAKEILASSD